MVAYIRREKGESGGLVTGKLKLWPERGAKFSKQELNKKVKIKLQHHKVEKGDRNRIFIFSGKKKKRES